MLTNTKKGLQYADFVDLLQRNKVFASEPWSFAEVLCDCHENTSQLLGISAIFTVDHESLYSLFQRVFNAETDPRSPLLLSIDVDILSEDELQEELNGDLPSLGQWVTHREFGSLECTARVVEKVAGRNVLIYQFEKGFSRG